MGFDVFASGEGFHYQKNGFFDGDDFTPIKVINELMTMDVSKAGVITAGIGLVQPDRTDLSESLATREFLHMLNDSVSFLAMCAGSANGRIMVSSSQPHMVWPTTKSFAIYNFQPGDDPGAEFIRMIAPGLKDTGMNTYGVLAALTIVLSKFWDHIGTGGTPRINISLDHH